MPQESRPHGPASLHISFLPPPNSPTGTIHRTPKSFLIRLGYIWIYPMLALRAVQTIPNSIVLSFFG